MLPSFHTQRLLIRPRSIDDLEACLEMDRDPEVTRFIPGPWSDPDRHRAFVLERMQAAYPAGLGYWAIDDRASGTFLGWVLLLPYRAFGDEIEIGWRLRRSGWGQGLATEAARPVLAHAFSTVEAGEVVADIHPSNTASIRVAEKLGMRRADDRVVAGAPACSYRLAAARFEEAPTSGP